MAIGDSRQLDHQAPEGGTAGFAVDVAEVAPLRAKDSQKRARAAALRAEAAATSAEQAVPKAEGAAGSPTSFGGKSAEDQAKASLTEALKFSIKAKGLLAPVEQRAYAAARAHAEAQVRRMEEEAKKYFAALMAEFNALAKPQVDANEEAVAKATEPYYNAELKLQGLVASYTKKADDMLAQARSLAGQAQTMATKATYEQANGDAENAQKHMIEAHRKIQVAAGRRKLAKRVRQLAENVNSAIPAYQQATQMAAHHAFETLPRL